MCKILLLAEDAATSYKLRQRGSKLTSGPKTENIHPLQRKGSRGDLTATRFRGRTGAFIQNRMHLAVSCPADAQLTQGCSGCCSLTQLSECLQPLHTPAIGDSPCLLIHICSATWDPSKTTLFHFHTKQGSCEKETTGKNYLCSKDDGKTTSNTQTQQFQWVRSTCSQTLTNPLHHTQTPLLLQSDGQMFRDKG